MTPKDIRETIEADPEQFLLIAREMAKTSPGIHKIMDTLNREAMHDRAKAMSELTNSSDREVTQDIALAALERLNNNGQYRRNREEFLAGEDNFGYVSGNIPMAAMVTLIEYARQKSVNDNPDLYVLQDIRSTADNRMLFWAKEARGYTTDLNEAHRFTKESALAQHERRSTDIPHRVGDLTPASGDMLVNAAQVSAMRNTDANQQSNTVPEPDWSALEGRKIGELTIDEHADAYELWMRNNITHGHQNYEMIRFLLDRLDQSRGKVDQVIAPSDNRTLDAGLDNGEIDDSPHTHEQNDLTMMDVDDDLTEGPGLQ